MPLITSNTDLKSLSFGHDRPGGGSSGQPFLFTGFNIPEVDFSYNQTLTDAYSASAGAGVGQNFFDIPPLTFDAPTFGYAPGNSTVKTTLFNGKGGYDWETVYNMPIWLRKFTFNRIREFYESQNKENNEDLGTQSQKIKEGKVDLPSHFKGKIDNSKRTVKY